MFALMNESYRETYHSTIEFKVEENKVYESKLKMKMLKDILQDILIQ